MKKLTTLILMLPIILWGQSNDLGTIHVSINSGGAYENTNTALTITSPKENYSSSGSGIGGGANLGLRASISVNHLISIGLFVRKEFHSSTNVNFEKNTTFSVFSRGFSIGPEVKIYYVNTEKLNAYISPIIGFSRATDKITVDGRYSFNGKSTGFIYGCTAGINKYFSDRVGFSLDFGLSGNSLNGNAAGMSLNYSNLNVGVYFGGGLVFKFVKNCTSKTS